MDAPTECSVPVSGLEPKAVPTTRVLRPTGLWQIAGLAVLYFLAGKLALRLAIVHPSATAVWPGTGLALAAILLLGYRVWPGIFAGAFLVNLTTAGSLVSSIGIATGNTLEAVVGAFLIEKLANGRNVFDRAEDIFKFSLFAGLLATAVSASLGTGSLLLTGFLTGAQTEQVWFTWWLGDMVGALMVTPCFLLWQARQESSVGRPASPRRIAALGSLLLTAVWVFDRAFLFGGPGFPLKFICIPFVAWAAFELRRHEVPLALVAFSAIPLGSAFLSNRAEITNASVVLLQVFLGVVAMTGLLISAAVSERNLNEEKLRSARKDLEIRVAERTRELQRRIEAQELTEQALQGLSARLLQVQDQERRRIARDLHDSTGQSLVILTMSLAQLAKNVAASHPELSQRCEEICAMARALSDEVRTTSYLLHPPLLDEVGLKSALPWYAQGFQERSKIKVTLQISENLGRLAPDIEIMIFRVVQECLTNVHRHAKSQTVEIRLLRTSDILTLEIQDHGEGIDRDRLKAIEELRTDGVGLRGMRERFSAVGGEMEILSDADGTLVRGIVPVGSAETERTCPDDPPSVTTGGT